MLIIQFSFKCAYLFNIGVKSWNKFVDAINYLIKFNLVSRNFQILFFMNKSRQI